MSDLISRRAAIDALGERPIVWTDDDQYTLGERNQYDIDRLAIETLPSAQPKPKKGRWIRLYYNRPRSYTRICSECRETCWFCGIGDYNYCPWCGARMRGAENEPDKP